MNSQPNTLTNGTVCPEIATALKIKAVGKEARKVFIERDEAISAMEVALACGEHLLMLGQPGTTKSSLVRYFAKAMQVNFFRYVLNPDTLREDLYGPIKSSALLNDLWERNWAGLATARVALLDEVGKASSQVLNLLLDAMEERLARSANVEHSLPIHSIFGASNETLDDETRAIWDRFTLRMQVHPIKEPKNFVRLLHADPENPPSLPIGDDELAAMRQKAYQMSLSVSPEVEEVMVKLWTNHAAVAMAGSYISDRRWKRTLVVAAGKALLNERDFIRPDDLDVCKWLLWDDYREEEKIKEWVIEVTQEGLSDLLDAEKLLLELSGTVQSKDLSQVHINQKNDYLMRANKLLRIAKEKGSKRPDLTERWKRISDLSQSIADTILE